MAGSRSCEAQVVGRIHLPPNIWVLYSWLAGWLAVHNVYRSGVQSPHPLTYPLG